MIPRILVISLRVRGGVLKKKKKLFRSLILAPEASLLFVFVFQSFAVASGFSRKGLSGYNSVITSNGALPYYTPI